MNQLPQTGFVRAKQLLGDPKNNIPPIIPVCKSVFWAMVKDGSFPAPVRLGSKCTAWPVKVVREFLASKGEVRRG